MWSIQTRHSWPRAIFASGCEIVAMKGLVNGHHGLKERSEMQIIMLATMQYRACWPIDQQGSLPRILECNGPFLTLHTAPHRYSYAFNAYVSEFVKFWVMEFEWCLNLWNPIRLAIEQWTTNSERKKFFFPLFIVDEKKKISKGKWLELSCPWFSFVQEPGAP